MIENILENFTPYLYNGKKFYEEEDVKKMMIQILQKNLSMKSYENTIEQYPEATC